MINSKKRYTVVSLFSGCGGLDRGFLGDFNFLKKYFKGHPFEIVWANEINAAACRTYKRNIGGHMLEGDVWDHIATVPSGIDVVIGGFPCQDISVNNIRAKGVNGKRSGLYRAMVEVVETIKPKVFVAENVKALLHRNNRNSMEQVLKDFTALGYNVTYQLYNAADYGVPQTRERVFIVGTRNGEFIHPDPVLNQSEWITAEDAISDLVNHPRDEEWSHIWSVAAASGHQGNRRLQAKRPGYTMRAECHGNTHFHYDLSRRMSMREGARIQSFSDDFIFESKLRETERQVGNAVPPVLAWHVANRVVEFLENKQPQPDTYQYMLDL